MPILDQFGGEYSDQFDRAMQRARNGDGRHKPVSFVEEHVRKMELQGNDPYVQIDGMPPNMGRYVLPHVQTFQGLFGSYSRAYRASDEALKHSRENARFMRNDPGVMECVESRQRSVALLDWQLIPEDEESDDQKQLCDELTKILRSMRRFTEYRRNLLHAIWYGRYAIQHSYNWKAIGGKMRVLPWGGTGYEDSDMGWFPVHGDKLVFRYDDGHIYMPGDGLVSRPGQLGVLVGARQQAAERIGWRWTVEPTGRGLAYFLNDWERRTFALHKHSIEDGAWHDGEDAGQVHGVGIRSRIYWDWFQKQEMLAFLMSYLERSAGGIEIWSYPAGDPNALAKAKQASKERLADGRNVVFFPRYDTGDGSQLYDIQVIEPGLNGIEMLKDILSDYYGHRIKRYVLGQTLSSEADATGLGSGLAELHLDTLLQIIKYDATNLEETITYELVRWIKDWNFPRAKNNHVRFVINTDTPDIEQKMAAFSQAFEMGAALKEREVMEMIGASIPAEHDRVLKKQEMPEMGAGGNGDGQPFGNGGGNGNGFAGGPQSHGLSASRKKMADDIMRQLFGDPEKLSGRKVTYVAEGGKWKEREIPDASYDTGERVPVGAD